MTEYNLDLFKEIYEQIKDPAKLDMGSWEGTSVCGTTRCVAGWAVHLTTGEPIMGNGATLSYTWHPSVEALSRRLLGDARYSLSRIGGALLGLDRDQASVLFYSQNEEALAVVKAFAEEKVQLAEGLLDYMIEQCRED